MWSVRSLHKAHFHLATLDLVLSTHIHDTTSGQKLQEHFPTVRYHRLILQHKKSDLCDRVWVKSLFRGARALSKRYLNTSQRTIMAPTAAGQPMYNKDEKVLCFHGVYGWRVVLVKQNFLIMPGRRAAVRSQSAGLQAERQCGRKERCYLPLPRPLQGLEEHVSLSLHCDCLPRPLFLVLRESCLPVQKCTLTAIAAACCLIDFLDDAHLHDPTLYQLWLDAPRERLRHTYDHQT